MEGNLVFIEDVCYSIGVSMMDRTTPHNQMIQDMPGRVYIIQKNVRGRRRGRVGTLPVLNERGVAMALAMHSTGAQQWRGRTSPKICDERERSSQSLVCGFVHQTIPRCDLEASL